MNKLLVGGQMAFSPYTNNLDALGFTNGEHFDLITFPEAFLPKNALIAALTALAKLASVGCVHVGLRPDTSEQHLFSVSQLQELLGAIEGISNLEKSDLEQFSTWLSSQRQDSRFNVGCLFMVDANGKLRVCLHPKMVRSKFERSALQEAHMTEADLVSLVTLLPTSNALLSITLQPLICSDALHSATDRPDCWPLEAVNADATSFSARPPDHIDIVSLATCTPQQELTKPSGEPYFGWHHEFRSAFKRMADDGALYRHHYSTVVLANFEMCPPSEAGGLSGAFIPLPFPTSRLPNYVHESAYGWKGRHADPAWTFPGELSLDPNIWSTKGYVASLIHGDRGQRDDFARMLGFTVDRLPRDLSRWSSSGGLVQFQLHAARQSAGLDNIEFQRVQESQ